MAKQGENLFEESSQGAVSAVTAFVFIVSLVLAMGGLVLMSYGFNPTAGSTTELVLFCSGLAASIIGFIIPFWVLPATGK